MSDMDSALKSYHFWNFWLILNSNLLTGNLNLNLKRTAMKHLDFECPEPVKTIKVYVYQHDDPFNQKCSLDTVTDYNCNISITYSKNARVLIRKCSTRIKIRTYFDRNWKSSRFNIRLQKQYIRNMLRYLKPQTANLIGNFLFQDTGS